MGEHHTVGGQDPPPTGGDGWGGCMVVAAIQCPSVGGGVINKPIDGLGDSEHNSTAKENSATAGRQILYSSIPPCIQIKSVIGVPTICKANTIQLDDAFAF